MVPQGEGYTLKLKTATSVTDLNSTFMGDSVFLS